MSPPVLILLLTDTRLSVYRATRQEAMHLADFDDSPHCRNELQTLIHKWRTADFHLLADLTEEEFHHESAPYLARADRTVLFQRKLDQTFRQTPYRRIAVQVPGKRGTPSKLVLSALTAQEKLDAIVALLLEARCAIAGIHSVALACEVLLAKRHLKLPHLLLVTPSPGNGLRQSYFTPEGLQFSRLASSPATDPTAMAEEVRRTRQFLTTTRQMQRDTTLEVLLLIDAGGDSAPTIQQLVTNAPSINARSETVAQFAAQLGFSAQVTDWVSLLCIAIACSFIPDHYRPIVAGRYHRLRRLEHQLHWGTALFVLLGICLALLGIDQTRRQQEDISRTAHNLKQQLKHQHAFGTKLKTLAVGQPGAMKEANELHRKYIDGWPDIEPTAQAISLIFADFPQLALEYFSWHATNSPNVSSLQDDENGTTPRTANQTGVSEKFDTRRWQVVELAGSLQSFSEVNLQSLEQLEQFATRLSRLPRTTVHILQRPLDLSSRGQISGDDTGQPVTKKFLIRMVIAPAEETNP